MADNTFENALLRERAYKELRGRRQFVDVIGVSETIRDDSRWHDYCIVALEGRVIHIFKALVALKRGLIFVTDECHTARAPQACQEVELDPFLRKAMLIVEDLVLVIVALDQNADFPALKSQNLRSGIGAVRISHDAGKVHRYPSVAQEPVVTETHACR